MARVYIRRGSDVKGSMYCNSDGKYIRIGDSRSDGIMYNIDQRYQKQYDDAMAEADKLKNEQKGVQRSNGSNCICK